MNWSNVRKLREKSDIHSDKPVGDLAATEIPHLLCLVSYGNPLHFRGKHCIRKVIIQKCIAYNKMNLSIDT